MNINNVCSSIIIILDNYLFCKTQNFVFHYKIKRVLKLTFKYSLIVKRVKTHSVKRVSTRILKPYTL